MKHEGQCLCGAVQVVLARDPPAVNMCHCADCQRRSGSPFGMAVWLMEADVTIVGETRKFVHVSDKGRELVNRFCPVCGSTICFTAALNPGLIAIPAGLFADPDTRHHNAACSKSGGTHGLPCQMAPCGCCADETADRLRVGPTWSIFPSWISTLRRQSPACQN